jgi:hypothetical protein
MIFSGASVRFLFSDFCHFKKEQRLQQALSDATKTKLLSEGGVSYAG